MFQALGLGSRAQGVKFWVEGLGVRVWGVVEWAIWPGVRVSNEVAGWIGLELATMRK